MAIQGYNVKLKKKETMSEVKIDKKGNRYFAKGTGSDGTKMSAILSKVNAEKALESGDAVKGQGW